MLITLYQVWSRQLPFTAHEAVLHGTRSIWHAPEVGAIELKDKILGNFYNKGIRAHVYIKEVQAEVDEHTLVIVEKKAL